MKEIFIAIIIIIFIAVVIVSCKSSRRCKLVRAKLDKNYVLRRGESKTISINLCSARFEKEVMPITNDDIKILFKNLDFEYLKDIAISNVRVINDKRTLIFTMMLNEKSTIHTDLTLTLFIPRPFLKFDREEESVMSIDVKGEIVLIP